MKAATGRVVITPPIGTPMGGNVRKDNKSRGVHDDLFCNILILEDDKRKICLLGFDLIGLRYTTCNQIKSEIEKVTGISSSDIMIWSTHTHSGPDTSTQMTVGIDDIINEYLNDVITKVASGVAAVTQNFQDVILRVGKTNVHDLNFNRRLLRKDGSVVMNFEHFEVDDIMGTTGPIDPELITLSAWDKENKLIAVLVNFTLHAAVLVGYKWLISRDFVHYLDESVIQTYGKQAITLFANGAEGNINALNYKDTDQLINFKEAERIGKRLGMYVSESIANSSVLYGKINFVSKKVTLPLRKISEEEVQWADMVLERDKDLEEDSLHGIPDKTYARMVKDMLVRKEKEFETILQGFAIHNFAMVTFPGEVYVEFGLKVKELSSYENTMILGLANSDSGYIPEEKAFSEGGYEVRTAWSSQLVYDAGNILVSLVKEKILEPLSK